MTFNADGLRNGYSNNSQDLEEDSLVKIVLLGSSVMLSAEVADSNALGYYLEKFLHEEGKQVEVLNMGVSSYGNDQALLYWQNEAKKFKPDIVIQGVHLSECWLNLNIFKYLSHPPTGILYTKPRAFWDETALQLKWVNLPTITPEKIVDSIIIDFEHQDYFEHEYFKNSIRYSNGLNILDNSYWYQIYHQFYRIGRLKDITNHQEGQVLMQELVNSLQVLVEKEHAQYLMLELSSYDDLNHISFTNEIPYQEIWKKLRTDKDYLSTYEFLSKESLDRLFVAKQASHYSDYGNRLIAKQLTNYLMKKRLVVKKKMD